MQQWIIRKDGSDRRMQVKTISVSVSVCLWDMCSVLLLQKGKHQLHSPAWAETPGWTKAVLGWRRWPCSLPHLHLYTYILSFLFSFIYLFKGGKFKKDTHKKGKFSEYSVLWSVIFSLLRATQAFQTHLVGLLNTCSSVIYSKEKNFTLLQAVRNEVLDLSGLFLLVDS